MYLIFDTETTGRPINYNAPLSDSSNWPRMVQLAWQLHDADGKLMEAKSFVIKPDGFIIPYDVVQIHGITTELANAIGTDIRKAFQHFAQAVEKAEFLCGHNVQFDLNIVGSELFRYAQPNFLEGKKSIDSMTLSTDFCAISGGKGGKFKWPKLEELHEKLFGVKFKEAHNAVADVIATSRCVLELIRIDVINATNTKISESLVTKMQLANTKSIEPEDIPFDSFFELSKEFQPENEEDITKPDNFFKSVEVTEIQEDFSFTHLHLHTQYSILDGLTKIKDLAKKAKELNMKAVAITDHGSMFGAKEFHEVMQKNGIKPIIGCEVYIASRTRFDKEKQDTKRYHLVLLAKNLKGYQNLIKLASIAYSEGYYYKPRIDKDVLKQYSEGLIALSACLAGEIPRKIKELGFAEGEKALLEYIEIFGDDFYLEIQKHQAENDYWDTRVYKDQQYISKELLSLAAKHRVKYVATNDVHFLNADDRDAHDRLICLNTNSDVNDPNRMKYTGQEWFKSTEEMQELFSDLPEALKTTTEICNKIEDYSLDSKPIMPYFALPDGFDNEDDYLKHLAYEGCKERYGELSREVEDRLEFELATVKKMGYPGYFLIVWDFIKAAREMGVSVGPGRGSAAGSVIAYALKIINVDPLRYNLLFERFLNPDRVSMPDIDVDFDDYGRDKVLEYVKNKYGEKRVASIITIGKMAAKSAIKDVARVQNLPLSEADRISKMIPEKPGTTLKHAFAEVSELKELKENGPAEIKSVLDFAERLEGSVRNTGTHACGVIIGRDDLDTYIPLAVQKDAVLTYVTQYDGHYCEPIGLLKMDFLGLKTLTIIQDALKNIKQRHGIEIDIDKISFEDQKTFELFGSGDTLGLFQFESDGMRKHLQNLKPTRLEDLIAMNALYRPGPMANIEHYIARKHGREKIEYDLDAMEQILSETYGITVYQEQVMLLSRKLANFTPGDSDSLRKAIGKKKLDEMEKNKAKFMDGCKENGHDVKIAEKIWTEWVGFAEYAFNKSHATCYAYIAFQTGYLKAHYPAEYMAAVLSHNQSDIKKLTFYLDESKRAGLKVLGPDVNESFSMFTVNKNGEIRFGLGGIKGVGDAAVKNLLEEREQNGVFSSVFDIAKRLDTKTINKKTMESLAYAGAFDSFGTIHRAQFFYVNPGEDEIFINKILKFGSRFQEQKNSPQVSLFGDVAEVSIQEPDLPICENWTNLKQLKFEKEVTGLYLSGHPLDQFNLAIRNYVTHSLSTVSELQSRIENEGQIVYTCGIVSSVQIRTAKNGNEFGRFALEDFTGSLELMMFAENYLKNKHFFVEDMSLFLVLRFKKSFRNENELDIAVEKIFLLQNFINETVKGINIEVNVEQINKEFTTVFQQMVKECKGDGTVRINLQQNGSIVEMLPMKEKVNIQEFAERIEKQKNIKYKLGKPTII